MSKTSWIIFSAVVVLLFGGLITWTRISNPPIDITGIDSNSVIAPNNFNGNIGDHVKGNKDSTVILVGYGDFQCPSCAQASPSVDALLEEYGDRIAYVSRNFPLTSIHPNARAAAGAAEAAGLQGKYWEMYSVLFASQDSWGSLDTSQRTTAFVDFAKQLDLDIEKFNTDLSSGNVSRKISFDQALGKRDGVEGTPNFFLNGKPLDTEVANNFVNGEADGLKALIDEALKK